MGTLSVVVPATDVPPTLERCRAALATAADGPDEVIVVTEPHRLSPAGARNAGVAQATGDVVVFVDADVVVHPDAFARIRAAFAADADLDAVYGAYDDDPGAPGLVSRFRNLLHHHVHHQAGGPSETFWTGLGAVRRDAFLAVGGFDEGRYPHPSIEDIELGYRLAASGARTVLDPAIQGTHLKAWTLRSMLWTDLARRGIPWVALQVRRRRLSSALNLSWRHRLSALACAVAVGAVVLGEVAASAVALGALLLLNRTFYALLLRRQGFLPAVAGVALHGAHHLVSLVAVPAGVAVAVVTAAGASRARRAAPATERPVTP